MARKRRMERPPEGGRVTKPTEGEIGSPEKEETMSPTREEIEQARRTLAQAEAQGGYDPADTGGDTTTLLAEAAAKEAGVSTDEAKSDTGTSSDQVAAAAETSSETSSDNGYIIDPTTGTEATFGAIFGEGDDARSARGRLVIEGGAVKFDEYQPTEEGGN